MSDSSPCELRAAWLCGCVPWAWPGSDPGEVSEIRHQRTNPQTPHCLIPTSLGTGTHAWQSTHSETPTPSSLQDTSWMLSGAPSVVRSGAALHVYRHRRVYGGGFPRHVYNPVCQLGSPESLRPTAHPLREVHLYFRYKWRFLRPAALVQCPARKSAQRGSDGPGKSPV